MKTNKFTKRNFLKWLRAQNFTRAFDYMDNKNCLFASFAKEGIGLKKVWCGGFHIKYEGSDGDHPFPLWALELNNKLPTYGFIAQDVTLLIR